MKKRLVSTVSLWAAAVAILLVGSAARAGSCISIQFIACCVCPPPVGCKCSCCDPTCVSMGPLLTATQSTGAALCSGHWNHGFGQAGVVANLMRETDGQLDPTEAIVFWEATNTSLNPSGSISFKDSRTIGDRNLMTDYLDQNTNDSSPTVQIINIPADMAEKFDLYIYTLTIVPSFGGTYAVNGGDPKYVLPGGNGVYIGPDFVEAFGDDPNFGERDWGNYVVFRGLSGTTVTITAINTPGGGKAPINGLQIVKSSF